MAMPSWIQEFSPDVSLDILTELALVHARLAGDNTLVSLVEKRDYKALCTHELDYEQLTAYQASHARQTLAFFQKLEFLDIGVDKKQAAVDKFMEAEQACRETNDIFRLRAQGSFLLEPWVESVLFRAQSKIAHVLGDVPTLEVLKLRFGPGATTLTKKRNASVVEKLQAGISCSEDVLPWAAALLEELPHIAFLGDTAFYSRLTDKEECARVPVLLTDGVVEFVPKSSKTFRSIIKEGSLNTLIQLAIGDYMGGRLRRAGLDLRDQSINQDLAKIGSISGEYATLDLSSASDTISTELVYNLLPVDWALLLDRSRSSKVLLGSERLALEKFSSMGNGFTFPLETLIFWAISSSACDDDFASIYGDDIVIRSQNVERVIRILEICGFTINLAKSYWQGPFRESCGADYLSGIDIRPCYCKKLLSYAELFRLHNFYRRRSDEFMAGLILEMIPRSIRLFGPDGYGDGHLLGDWLPYTLPRHTRSGYGGVLFDTYVLRPNRDDRAGRAGDRVLPLYAIYIRENGDDVLDAAEPETLGNLISYLRIRRRTTMALAPLEIPERVSPVDGSHIKRVAKPGTSGYKKVSIYVFNRA